MDSRFVLLAHLGATWFMTGLIWFVQIVHYPLMRMVGREGFVEYSRRHQARTSLVVGPLMPVEALTTVLLLAQDGDLRGSWPFWVSCGLLVVVWGSTALWQMPIHQQLLSGYDECRVRALVRSNWLRTLAWTGRAMIVTYLVFQRMQSAPSQGI